MKNKLNEKPDICIVTYPRPSASVTPLLNLTKILSEISNSLYLITGNEGKYVLESEYINKGYSVTYKKRAFIPFRLIEHLILQIKIAKKIAQYNKNVNLYVFYMGDGLVLPMLTCRILRKPAVIAIAGSISQISIHDRDLLSSLFVFMEKINYLLAEKILIYSPRLITEWGLQRYSKKIYIVHEQYIESHNSKVRTHEEGKSIVSFIGRLSEEKGIVNLIKAIPLILQERHNISFLIGGDGKLKKIIEKYVSDNNLVENVEICGWIRHDELLKYFIKTRLLIIPSFTEGLPNIMLEAMASCVPVAASNVGAIPDVIVDEETGFILENNSPECIAKNVLRALNNPRLEQIAENGCALVKKEFTLEKAKETYRKALNGSIN
jgi:glycosyltransferase involved in cell wall biosynthesis